MRTDEESHELESLPSGSSSVLDETPVDIHGRIVSARPVRDLFPQIDWDTGEQATDGREHIDMAGVVVLPGNSSPGAENEARSVVDDAGSSVCIDDDVDLDVDQVVDMLARKPAQGSEPTDFDEYNRQVARDFVLREKAERRLRRVRETRQYGNYFSSPYQNGASGGTYTPSHNFDNFNGKRQNARYNHQLNILNSPYTYEEQQRRRQRRKQRALSFDRVMTEEDLEAARRDNVSIMTMDLDELESDDGSSLSGRGLGYDGGYAGLGTGAAAKNRLHRAIQLRDIEMFAVAGALSVGFFLNSSQAFATSGPVGALLGYVIAGLIVLAAMLCQGEIMALLPGEGGVAACAARFVDESLGFALGVCYWLSCAISLPADITAVAMMMSSFPFLDSADNSVLVWITFFLVLVLLVNLIEVGSFMRIQAATSLVTVVVVALLLICMWCINDGSMGHYNDRLGFRYWDTSKAHPDEGLYFGPFRPQYAIESQVTGIVVTITQGIGGGIGRFLQVWYALTNALYAFLGTEIVFTTVAEVRTPRRSIPSAARKTFYRVFLVYVLSIFSVGMDIYAGDSRLVNLTRQHPPLDPGFNSSLLLTNSGCPVSISLWNNYRGPNSSPWVVAFQRAGLCSLASASTSVFIVLSMMSAIMRLYGASRTLHGMAAQGLMPEYFTYCTKNGVPYMATIASGAFGVLAYINGGFPAIDVYRWFVHFTTSSTAVVWAGVCVAFIRFYRGISLRSDSVRRNDESYPFRTPFQPFVAYFGAVACSIIVVFLGLELFLEDEWETSQFFAIYSPPVLVIILYVVRRAITRSPLIAFADMDFDTERKAMENIGWAEDRVYHRGVVGLLKKYTSRARQFAADRIRGVGSK